MQLLYMARRRPDGWLVEALREMGHAVELGEWGAEAAALATEGGYDLVLADLAQVEPETVAALSEASPMLVVVADAADAAERAAALRAGAEACLVRPLHLIEVQTRLMAMSRHADRARAAEAHRPGVKLDRGTHRLALGGREARLSGDELRLVAYLFRREGQVVDLQTLDRHLAGEESEPRPERVRSLVARLRAKLRRDLGAPLIHSVRGQGYVLRAEAAPDLK